MSVVDKNVIDFGHEDDDKVTICISDHIPWNSEILQAHLEVLQDKVNTYLDYIESGQIYDDFGGNGKIANIKVIFCHAPSDEAVYYIEKIQEAVVESNISFEWIYRPE